MTPKQRRDFYEFEAAQQDKDEVTGCVIQSALMGILLLIVLLLLKFGF